MTKRPAESKPSVPISTVGRRKATTEALPTDESTEWSDELVQVKLGDSLGFYDEWDVPTVIVSDGGYGILGFQGDTADHIGLPDWYAPHIEAWSRRATPATTLWFWNSEIGWAVVHPILEAHGWQYVNANVWNKGKGHIAGNVNTQRIRRFPVVSELCVQYVYEAKVEGLELKRWLLQEWKRTSLPLRRANEACGVADAAVRKYLDQTHLWYAPSPETFVMLQEYANEHGAPEGRPYFTINGKDPATAEEWAGMKAKFYCPHGFTNVWERPALRGPERFKTNGDSGRAIHFNQKPLDLMTTIIEASSDVGDVVWEPFGGLFTACIAARIIERKAFGAEIDPAYFRHALRRLEDEAGHAGQKASTSFHQALTATGDAPRKPRPTDSPRAG